MKSLMQIAQECNLTYNELLRFVKRYKIIPAKRQKSRLKNSYKIFFDKYQEDLIHYLLFCSGKITEITLESKMNIKEP
jgi:hypothetical protein